MTDCQCQGKGFPVCPWGLGLFSKRGIRYPPLSPSHPTQLMRCVTHVRFLVFGSRQVEGGGKQPSIILGTQAASPVDDTLESLPVEPQHAGMSHFSSGAVSQASFLTRSLPPAVCLSSLLHRERAPDLPSAGLKKDTCVPKWWFYFFSFMFVWESVDKVKNCK